MVLPLEGTPATGAADDGILRELLDAGVAPLVLHVFDESTVPMFWDDALEVWGALRAGAATALAVVNADGKAAGDAAVDEISYN